MKKLLFLLGIVLIAGCSQKVDAKDITIVIPDAEVTRIENAIAAQLERPDFVGDPLSATELIPNPETKSQFLERKITEWLESHLVSFEGQVSAKTASDTAEANAKLVDITIKGK